MPACVAFFMDGPMCGKSLVCGPGAPREVHIPLAGGFAVRRYRLSRAFTDRGLAVAFYHLIKGT